MQGALPRVVVSYVGVTCVFPTHVRPFIELARLETIDASADQICNGNTGEPRYYSGELEPMTTPGVRSAPAFSFGSVFNTSLGREPQTQKPWPSGRTVDMRRSQRPPTLSPHSAGALNLRGP